MRGGKKKSRRRKKRKKSTLEMKEYRERKTLRYIELSLLSDCPVVIGGFDVNLAQILPVLVMIPIFPMVNCLKPFLPIPQKIINKKRKNPKTKNRTTTRRIRLELLRKTFQIPSFDLFSFKIMLLYFVRFREHLNFFSKLAASKWKKWYSISKIWVCWLSFIGSRHWIPESAESLIISMRR